MNLDEVLSLVWTLPGSGCWIWAGEWDERGYGVCEGKPAYRVVYESLVGKPAKGLQLDHLCLVKPCVNPVHLEPVTRAENYHRRLIKGPSFPISKFRRKRKNRRTVTISFPESRGAGVSSLLERFGLTQREFASLIETDYSAVHRWAVGKTNPSGGAKALLDLFEIRPELVQVLRDLRRIRRLR